MQLIDSHYFDTILNLTVRYNGMPAARQTCLTCVQCLVFLLYASQMKMTPFYVAGQSFGQALLKMSRFTTQCLVVILAKSECQISCAIYSNK